MSRAEHGPVWSGLTEKSDQTRNSGLEIFQTSQETRPDRSRTVWFGLVYGFFIFFLIFNF